MIRKTLDLLKITYWGCVREWCSSAAKATRQNLAISMQQQVLSLVLLCWQPQVCFLGVYLVVASLVVAEQISVHLVQLKLTKYWYLIGDHIDGASNHSVDNFCLSITPYSSLDCKLSIFIVIYYLMEMKRVKGARCTVVEKTDNACSMCHWWWHFDLSTCFDC